MRLLVVIAMFIPSLVFSAYSIENGASKLTIGADMLNSYQHSNALGSTNSVDTFSNLRGRLFFCGNLNNNVSYSLRLKFQPSTIGTTPESTSTYEIVDVAFMTYKISEAFNVLLGKNTEYMGLWKHYSLGGMSPQSFIIGGTKLSSQSALGAEVFGKYDILNYSLSIYNDKSAASRTNSDRKFDVTFHTWFTNGLDINLYKIGEGFKYLAGLGISNIAGYRVSDKLYVDPYAIISFNNAFLTTSAQMGLYKRSRKDYEYQIGAGYLFAEQFRAAMTYRVYRIEGTAQKAEHTLATQFMVFTYEGKFKPFVEYGITAKTGQRSGKELRIGTALNI